jgi:hypothetical protein
LILRGRPAAVEVYEARLKEKATIMEEVPLTVPAPRSAKKRTMHQSSNGRKLSDECGEAAAGLLCVFAGRDTRMTLQ